MGYNLMKGELTVEITVAEYRELAQTAEKVNAVKRLAEENEYMCVKDILAVLGIDREGEKNVEN